MPKLSLESVHALLMAMQNELDTVQIYEHMLKHLTDPKAREVLYRLIVDEHDHERKIHNKILEGGIELLPENLDIDINYPDRSQLLEMELNNCSVSELVHLALESELMNRDFYKIQYDRARNPEVREIFKWLFEQEELHIVNIKKEYGSYLA